jgi:DNA ligase (NAD+)
VGDDITANIKTMRAIPLELKLKDPPKLLEVRGEAFIAIKDFDKLNAKFEAAGEAPFPNARNATAGTLKQLDPRIVAKRGRSGRFFTLWAFAKERPLPRMTRFLLFLKEAGLPTQPIWWVCHGIQEVLKRYRNDVVCHYDEGNDLRTKVPYEIDGIVLKVNDLDRSPKNSFENEGSRLRYRPQTGAVDNAGGNRAQGYKSASGPDRRVDAGGGAGSRFRARFHRRARHSSQRG